MTTKGTKEWASSNINFQSGCKAGCEYCYAREMSDRFKRKRWDDWINIEFREKDLDKQYRKRNGTIMFPSSHNIDESNYTLASCVLAKLVTSRNKVLIVMKPERKIIKKLCKDFFVFRSQIELRYTITTFQDRWRERFEPYSSPIPERISSIKLAHKYGFVVSVAVEPFLDADPLVLIRKLVKRNVDPTNIWIGPMNHRKELSRRSDVIFNHSAYLNSIYLPLNLKSIYGRIMTEGWKINFKDGFLNQMKSQNTD